MWPDGTYVMQNEEEVKSARPVTLVAVALYRLPPRPTKSLEIEALTRCHIVIVNDQWF